jgi:hypothetical protein
LTCSSLKLILLPDTSSDEIGLVQVPYAAIFLAELIFFGMSGSIELSKSGDTNIQCERPNSNEVVCSLFVADKLCCTSTEMWN